MRAADRIGLPRLLHPVAWWAWGLGLATAASRTTNPVLLLLVIAVAAWCVTERREAGRSGTFAMFLWIGLFAIALRVVMAALLGAGVTGRIVLFRLPEIPLPAWTSGVRLGGAVTAEGLVAAASEGLRLAAILVCLGAANTLASPRRLLRYLPATLYDVGTAVVVGLTFAPQLAHEAARVRAARRLRGHSGKGLRELARLLVPVLENAFERSLELAASMESRGYGRAVQRSEGRRRRASGLAMVGLLGVVAGLYGLFDASTPTLLGLPLLVTGAAVAAAALWAGAARDRRSSYRRDPWGLPEWGVLACGVVPAAVLVVGSGRAWPGLTPVQVPLSLPAVPVLAVVAVAVGAVAAVLSPVPPRRAQLRAAARRKPEREAVAAP